MNKKKLLIILGSIITLLVGIGIYLIITKPNYQKTIDNILNTDIPFLNSLKNNSEEEEEVLPSDLRDMVKSPTSFENWDKYTNTEYVDIVKNLDYDSSSLNNPNPENGILLVYIYYNNKTEGRISFSAYDKYPEDSLVESIFEAILNDTSEICPAKFYEVSGGNTIKGNWSLNSFTPQKHPGALDTAEDYHPVDVISFKDESGQWKTTIQGSSEYNKMVEIISDDILEPMAKTSRLNLSKRMNEEGCYNY